MAEMQAIAQIKRKIFAIDPRNTATLSRFVAPPVSLNLESITTTDTLIWGSIACRELWMWSDESGNGLGLDVTMKE